MNIVEKFKERKRLKGIKETVYLLKNECGIKYDNPFADSVIYRSGQRYAERMYEILEYYKTKNPQICEAVMRVIDKYGKIGQRIDYKKQMGHRLTSTIQLIIPEEIGLKINKIYNKMTDDKKAELNEFANKLDELAK